MESPSPGQLVNVAGAGSGPGRHGIVFDTPSAAKVVVAVVDPRRGPVLRTFNADALSERDEEGAADPALRRLLRRTPPPGPGAARSGTGVGRGRAGHGRAAMHRTTGK